MYVLFLYDIVACWDKLDLTVTYIDLIQLDILVRPFHFLCADLHGFHLRRKKYILKK